MQVDAIRAAPVDTFACASMEAACAQYLAAVVHNPWHKLPVDQLPSWKRGTGWNYTLVWSPLDQE
jgi:hypothetical protein